MKVDLEPFILHTGRDPFREQYIKSATWSRLFGFGGDDVEPARSYHVRKGCDLIGSSNTVSSHISLFCEEESLKGRN